jgi:hypothetical protein
MRGGVVHDGREQEPDGDGPLVSTDDQTSDPFWSRFGLVERN